MSPMEQTHPHPLPTGVTSRIINDVNGLSMHILEAGNYLGTNAPNVKPSRPLILLLHGFPELAYSYRKVIQPLSSCGSGYHVVAPDQRGYGRTTGWDTDGLSSFRMLNLVTDIVALVLALGYRTVNCVVGHDFGSPVAAYCALIRLDMFRSVVMMSAPFPGPPSFPTANTLSPSVIAEQLLSLDPPRVHYQQYYSPPSTDANRHMMHAPQGFFAFLRAYYHVKSADWPLNAPFPLTSWSASELAKMPEYYIMRADKTIAETVAPHLPSVEPPWLSDAELSVYVTEFERTSLQGGLSWYQFLGSGQSELLVFAGKHIEVPALFISGEKDWGMYQAPGSLHRMQSVICERMEPGVEGCAVVKDAGHWVQQEKPEEVIRIIGNFLNSNQGNI